jgi:hypothetical protein
MHGPINVESPNNTSKWQMEFNSAFKGLNRETLVVASDGVVLEVNAEKTKYIGMSGGQNAAKTLQYKKDNKSFGTFQIIGNNINKSKFHSGRN